MSSADCLTGFQGSCTRAPWVDFGHNRTELMALARSKADYLLLLDADMTVSYDRARLRGLEFDSYMLRHAEEPEYWVKRLVRGTRRWPYVGACLCTGGCMSGVCCSSTQSPRIGWDSQTPRFKPVTGCSPCRSYRTLTANRPR